MAWVDRRPFGQSAFKGTVDADPTAGLVAPIGSIATLDTGLGTWHKIGAGNTDWAPVAVGLAAAAAPDANLDVADGVLVGTVYTDTSTTPPTSYVCQSNAAAAAVWRELSGVHITGVLPTVNDDSDAGYTTGSMMYGGGAYFHCTDATPGAAVWRQGGGVGIHLSVSDPTITDDDSELFQIGALWANATTGATFVCIDNSTGAAQWDYVGGMVRRLTIAAESALTGAGMGATTETAHTPITLLTALLNVARRTIRFKALLHCVDDNAADTWTTKVYIGAAGLGGVEIFSTGAINNVTGDLWEIRGEIYIATAGGGGTFHSVVHGELETGPADTVVYVTSGAIDTTVNRDLTVSAESSSNHADQEVTLVHFEAEVVGA
jgi:hypothetical protein